MKTKLIFFWTALLLITISNNGYSDDFYYYRDTKIPLQRVPNKYYLQTDTNFDASKSKLVKDVFKKQLPITNLKTTERFKLFNDNKINFGYWSAIVSDADISVLEKMEGVRYVAPVFLTKTKRDAILSNFIYLRLKNADDFTILKEFADKYSFDIIGNLVSMPLWFLLSCDKNSAGNALQLANILFETEKFSAVEPDLMTDDLNCVNDPYFVNGTQWNLNGAFGINYCAARAITTGHPDVIVAVVDQGISRNHPDITNFHYNSFDAETGTSPSRFYPIFTPAENHGTPVAGIIGANSNNGLGIASVAPNCRLMDISSSLSSTPYSRMRLADGIDWAWQNGASVINNSWSFDGVGGGYAIVEDAIDNALQFGRGGKGTIVVFAAGNSGINTVNYPARSNPNIIAVGATISNGQRLAVSSFGTALDIVAPGGDIYTTSTHISGYLPESGTSFAAPHVSGVAALILSVNPNLTHQQVKNIIESTARKVGGYNYQTTAGRPNGTWHQEMGYGLLDAGAAVEMARSLCMLPSTYSGTTNVDTTVYGGHITTSNITVQSGKLTITGCSGITITGDLIVQPGGSLDIKAGP